MLKPQWAAAEAAVEDTDQCLRVEAELRANNRDFEYGDENKRKDVRCAMSL